MIKRGNLHPGWSLKTLGTQIIRLISLDNFLGSLDICNGWAAEGDRELRLKSFLETVYYLW